MAKQGRPFLRKAREGAAQAKQGRLYSHDALDDDDTLKHSEAPQSEAQLSEAPQRSTKLSPGSPSLARPTLAQARA